MRATLGLIAAYMLVAVVPSAAAPSDAAPQSIWTRAADGAGTHVQSALQCPAAVGPFLLKRLTNYDAFGLDIGCDYWTGDDDITLYLTKRGDGETLQEYVDGALAAIPQHFPDAKRTDQAPGAPSPAAWQSAMFTIRGGTKHSAIWVVDMGGWTFKFRATYAPDADDRILAAVRSLVATADRTARRHLEACANSGVPRRGAAPLEDKTRLGVLALATMVGLMARPDERGATPVWCAERGIAVGQTPFLLMHNIAPGSYSVDRLLVMTIGPPVAFDTVASPYVRKVLSEIQQNGGETWIKGELHQVMQFEGQKAAVFAFFDGRPDGETLAQLVTDIRAGRRGPLAAADPATKTISVAPQ